MQLKLDFLVPSNMYNDYFCNLKVAPSDSMINLMKKKTGNANNNWIVESENYSSPISAMFFSPKSQIKANKRDLLLAFGQLYRALSFHFSFFLQDCWLLAFNFWLAFQFCFYEKSKWNFLKSSDSWVVLRVTDDVIQFVNETLTIKDKILNLCVQLWINWLTRKIW